MAKHIGIVLRKNTKGISTFFILDKDLGKIHAASDRSDISCGSLIMYNFVQHHSVAYIGSINIVELPTIQSIDDLIFFHHVLELAYYFIPLGNNTPEIFDLLLFLYTSLDKLYTYGHKKLFLCKFFAHLGFYPEWDRGQKKFFHLVRTLYIDTLLESLDLFLERKLDRWLDYCISLHPCVDCFKTVSFFMGRKS